MTQALEARERYAAEFRRRAGNGAAGAPQWLEDLRQGGIDRFAAVGFPTTREEAWRFTDVAPVVGTPFSPPRAAGAPVSYQAVEMFLGGPSAWRLVFVDGAFNRALSSVSGLPQGVRLGSLAEAFHHDGDVVAEHLGRHARIEHNPFTALNTAFLQDGALVHVAGGVSLEQPLYLLFLTSPAGQGSLTHPRNLVILERGAAATVVESYISLHGHQYLTNAVTELVLGEGARAQHLRIQQESDAAFHMATSQSYQSKDSRLLSCSVALGSTLSRHDVSAVLDGTGAELLLNGLSVLARRQHVDYHTTIEHAQPHGESHELFNGIFADQARGVFTGRIIVRPGAQQTDSKQTNNNVLLSETARADSQPQLEIYADDVKCTHGATIGPLDPNALFYLETRGVGADDARQLLTYGFAADIVSRLETPELRDLLERLVGERLAA